MNYSDKQGTLLFFDGKYKYFPTSQTAELPQPKSQNLFKKICKLFSTEIDDWLHE